MKSLRDLKWKKIIKEILINWLHIIGIVSLIGCALFMNIATISFILYGGILFYEYNIIISIIEFFTTVYAFLYGWYLMIKLYNNIGT